MNSIIEWMQTEWLSIFIPFLIFGLMLLLTFWVRKVIYDYFRNRFERSKWKANEKVIESFRGPSAIWCLVVSVFVSFYISNAPSEWKVPVGRSMWTLLLISLAIPLLKTTGNVIEYYGRQGNLANSSIVLFRNIARTILLIFFVLAGLEVWGIPTQYLVLILVVAILTLLLIFREAFPNFFAGIQLSANQQINVGDYVKLENGEEGYITKIGWNNTFLQTAQNSLVTVPNNALLQRTVVNCGHPLKKTSDPFLFYKPGIIKEHLGIKATNTQELLAAIRIIPNESIYCHTYRCLQENPQLSPDGTNDFACWARDVLGDSVLAKKLSSVQNLGITDLKTLRYGLISVLEEPKSASPLPQASSGQEFIFMKAFNMTWQTQWSAHDLREFTEILRKLGFDSLYFHLFGRRLATPTGLNDYSAWLENSLNENELSGSIQAINPYFYTPEALRSELIRLIEKHIK